LLRDFATRLSVEILQLKDISFENDCNRQNNDLEVYTPKVIVIAAFK